MARGGALIRVEGLRDLQRGLSRMERATFRTEAFKKAAQIVATEAQGLAPRRSGALRDSIRGTTRGFAAVVRTPLVYGNPIHWGWPSHHIKPSLFIVRAAENKLPQIEGTLMAGLEAAARQEGFKVKPRG